MSWLADLDKWWENRGVLRKKDFDNFKNEVKENYERSGAASVELYRRMSERLDKEVVEMAHKLKTIEESNQIPQLIAKEIALIKARLDRLELLTGLKREPAPTQVEGAPRIS